MDLYPKDNETWTARLNWVDRIFINEIREEWRRYLVPQIWKDGDL